MDGNKEMKFSDAGWTSKARHKDGKEEGVDTEET